MNEIGRCRDCRWWDNWEWESDPPEGECTHQDGPHPASCRSAVMTSPDFGCVLFEAKP